MDKGANSTLTGQSMTINQMQPMDMMNGPPVMMQSIQYQNYIFCKDPMEELKLSAGAVIRKEIKPLSGSEAENNYSVFIQSKNALKMAFKCVGSNKGLKIRIFHITSEKYQKINEVFARAEKSRRCLCFSGPCLNIRLGKYQSPIGGIRECIGSDYEIYDDRDNVLYKIINFDILKNDVEVGNINKKNMSIEMNSLIAETYELFFPSDATPESKLILIFAVMLIDINNFEKESQKKK